VTLIRGPIEAWCSTEELLRELAWRMKETQDTPGGWELGNLCEEALENLDRQVLEYLRTEVKVDNVVRWRLTRAPA